MNKGGLHLQASPSDWARMMSMGGDTLLGMQFNLPDLYRFRREKPNGYNILRHYDVDTMAQSAEQRARQHFEFLMDTGVYQQIDLFIPLNEQNLWVEHPGDPRLLPHPNGGTDSYSWWETREGIEYRDGWTLGYMGAFGSLCSKVGVRIALGGPAESPGHNVWLNGVDLGVESEYQFQVRSLAAWDVWVAHCYGDPADQWTGGRWRLTLAKMNELTNMRLKPLVITEFNGGDFATLLLSAAAEPQVKALCWFLYQATDTIFKSMELSDSQLQLVSWYLTTYKEEVFMDQVTLWLADVWRRQGVDAPRQNDAMWNYAVEQAHQGRFIYPMPTTGGSYQNWDNHDWVIGYTNPPLFMRKGTWAVTETPPPNS